MPAYQRAYAWTDEEIADFISDIRSLYQSRHNRTPTNHFFGGLVTVLVPVTNTSVGHQYDVVDGQQRLATFGLLLACFANGFEALEKQAKKVQDQQAEAKAAHYANSVLRGGLLEYAEMVNNQTVTAQKIVLSKADRTYYHELLQRNPVVGQPQRESHKRLRKAFLEIRSKLVDLIVNDTQLPLGSRVDELVLAFEASTKDCNVISITTQSREEAYLWTLTLPEPFSLTLSESA